MKKIIASNFTLPIVWIFFFVLTHWPKEEMPETPFIPYIDKVVHFSLFVILGFLLSQRLSGIDNYKKQLRFVLAVLGAYGAFDEMTQPIVGRTAELLDWIADISGAFMGFFLQQHWAKKIMQATDLHD